MSRNRAETVELATKPQIMIVEDEAHIATMLRYNLEKTGFAVIETTNGEDALTLLAERKPDAVLLDWGLPLISGFEVCRRIRCSPELKSLPVIMLTARGEEEDRVRGLDVGADDYVTKPFSPRELVARVRAVLRRAEPDGLDGEMTIGDVIVQPAGRTVSVAGSSVELTGMEFDLLAFLAAHPGIVMSRERLLERVWGLAFPGGTRTVDVHVAQLRKKLDRPDLIRTVRGSGYKAVA